MNNTNEKYNENGNRILPQSHDNILCVEINEIIESKWFVDNVINNIRDLIEEHGKIRTVIYYKDFKGWHEDATLDDMEAIVRYGKNIERIALVTPPQKEVAKTTLVNDLLTGEIKVFAEGEFEKALAWVESD